MHPRLVELCFQTAGVWELGITGRMALPTHIDRVLTSPGSSNDARCYAVVTPRGDDAFDAAVVDETGAVRVRLDGYRTIAVPGGVDNELLPPLHTAMS
jgi:hypothetical protein